MASFNDRWSEGGLLDQQSSARTRLINAQAARIESGLRDPGPQSIIGGQFVDANDTAGRSAAITQRDAFNNDYQARVKAQQPPTFAPNSLRAPTQAGAAPNPIGQPSQPGAAPNPIGQPSQPGMNGDSAYPGGPSYESLLTPQGAGAPGTVFQSGPTVVMNKNTPDFTSDVGRGPLRSKGNTLPSTTLGDEFNTESKGFRNGGMFTKQRTVKQPGYQSGGKVKTLSIPEQMRIELRASPEFQAQVQEAIAAGYWQPDKDPKGDIAAVDRMMWDRNAPEREARNAEIMQRAAARDMGADMPRGYACGGEVKRGMRGYQRGGPVTDNWQYLENVNGEMREVPKPEPAPKERPFVPNPKNSILTETFRQMQHNKTQKKGMRGYAVGGRIGDVMQDDGRDSMDVRVREGEYLVAPEGVKVVGEVMGGGAETPYENGIAFLDQANQAGTGKQPGPVPVNEEGEEVGEEQMERAQGLRYGGGVKPGFIAGGTMFVDKAGNTVQYINGKPVLNQPAMPAVRPPITAGTAPSGTPLNPNYRFKPSDWTPPPEPKYTRMDTRFHGPTQPAQPRSASGFRQALSGKHTTTVGDVARGAGRGIARGIARGARAIGGGTELLRGSAPLAGIMGAWQGGQTPTEDYAARMGIDYPETLLGELGVRTAGVLSDVGTAFVDPFIEIGNAVTNNDVPTLRSKFADVQVAGGTGASIPAQLAGAETFVPTTAGSTEVAPLPAPTPYFRPFGGGQAYNLRHPDTTYSAAMPVPAGDARVVQRTGGPNGEVIVREDVNGVPTFSNLRTTPQAGDAATLQAQADARAAEDMQIRAQQGQVVEQMRQNAPLYTQEAIDQRRAQQIAQLEAQNRGRSTAATKPLDLRKELEQQFQIPKVDENGDITGYTYDQDKIQLFESVISQMNPEIAALYGAPFHELPLELRQQVYAQIDPVMKETAIAMRAQKNEEYPTDSTPRTGRNSLRIIPNSDISFWGDTVFGDAKFDEYRRGMWNSDPRNDLMVTDPLSGNNTRIPLQRLLKANRDNETEALRRYGYFDLYPENK